MQTHLTEEQALSPFSWYRTMRQEHPVFFDEQTKAWHVFRYTDVARVLTDYGTFHKILMPSDTPDEIRQILSGVLQTDDPLNHRQVHNIAMQAFTPQVMAQLEPRISKIINNLLDKVLTTGGMDVMKDLAYPLPLLVIAEMLGIPEEQHKNFKNWVDTIKREASFTVMGAKIQEMSRYFDQVLEERRRHPQDDLVSALVAAEMNGQRLSNNELLGFCVVLLASGTNSVTGLIGNAIFCFDEFEIMDRLRTEPELMSGAIEEVLRYRAPIQALRRATMKETTLGGQHIGPRQTIIAWVGSANHDEAQFPDPERFDIQRWPNRHLAFSHGIYFCIGAALARLQVKTLLNAMLGRVSNLRLKRDRPLAPVIIPGISAFKTLPVTFNVSP